MKDDTDDPFLDALERAADYFDAGFVAGTESVRPSSLMIIRYCVLMTDRDPACHDHARRLVRGWLAEGRRRWRAGFNANPLAPEPLTRRSN